MANYFRLYLHCLAANLLVRLRAIVADPPAPQPASELPQKPWLAKIGNVFSTNDDRRIRWVKGMPRPGV